MKQIYYRILGAIVIIGIVFIVGCFLQEQKSEKMAELPPIYLESTVIFILDKDSATIKIDKISSEHKLVGCDIMGTLYPVPKERDEITVPFYYSTGPAIIRTVPLADVGDSNIDQDASSSDVGAVSPGEISKKQEGDYLVTTIESSAVDEIQEEILSGLEEGSKFKTTIYSSCVPDIQIYKYEIIL